MKKKDFDGKPYILLARVEDEAGSGAWVMVGVSSANEAEMARWEIAREVPNNLAIGRSVMIENTDRAWKEWSRQESAAKKRER